MAPGGGADISGIVAVNKVVGGPGDGGDGTLGGMIGMEMIGKLLKAN